MGGVRHLVSLVPREGSGFEVEFTLYLFIFHHLPLVERKFLFKINEQTPTHAKKKKIKGSLEINV